MARLLSLVLTIILFYSSTGSAYIRDYSKAEHLWTSESKKAYVLGKTNFEDGTTIINLFIIAFEEKYRCKPVFKIAFLESYAYGDLLKTIPLEAGLLKLYVDNKLIYDGPIVKIIHTNATEFGAYMSPEMLNHIYGGKIIAIELADKMDILFNLNNAKSHIDKAQESCLQEQ